MGYHDTRKMVIIIITVVMFVVMATFNGLAASSDGAGVFTNNTGTISDVFYLEIVPAGWTFSIWGFIYAWQALWLVYCLTTICRRKVGTFLYMMPMFPSAMFLFYIANNLFNVAWLFAWDRAKIAIALPLIALTPFTLYICLFFSFKTLYDNLSYMQRNGLNLEIWFIRLFIQNGLAFYAAWVTVATLINVGVVMTYKDGSDVADIAVAQDISSTVVLSIVAFEIVLWFTLDIFFLDKYTRYVFTPYITLAVALIGIIQKNYDLDRSYRNSIFSLALAVAAGLGLLVKTFIMIWRHLKRPIEPVSLEIKPTF